MLTLNLGESVGRAAGGALTASLLLDASAASVMTGSYSGAPEGLFTSAIAPKYLFNVSGNLAQQNQLFRTQTESSTLAMPEVSVVGGAPGHGFTNTGLDIDASGNFIIGCDGGATEDIPSSSGAGYTCGIVKVSPAGANLGEINIRSLFGLGQTATVQGIACDRTDNSIWVGCGTAGVKHCSAAGGVLSGSFMPASGNANGLTIDTLRDRILVGAPSGSLVGNIQIDAYNRSDRSFIATTSFTANGVGGAAGNNFGSPDHLYYDAARDYLWVSDGANGTSGRVSAFKASDFTLVGSATLTQCTAIEGFVIQNGQLILGNDGYYHSITSGGNGFNQLQYYPAALGKANVNFPVEYDPVSHTLLGYRIEPSFQRGNGFVISPANVSWTKTNVTATANSTTSPTGASDATLITASAGTAVHEATKASSVSIGAGGKAVTHDMLKAGTARYVWTGDRGDASIHSATFDLQAGTVVGSSNCTASIKDMGNGWYRCTRAFTRTNAGAPGGNVAFGSASHTLDHASFNAAGTETFYIYAHEIGGGEYPTSAVFSITDANSETRAADTISLPTSSFNFSATVNSFVATGRTARGVSASTKQVLFQIDDGSESNRIRLERNTSKELHFIVSVSGSDVCDLNLGVVADETDFKVAARCRANDFSAALNGGAVVTDSAGALPTVTTLRPGMSFTGEQWAGWLKTLTIYASAVDDAALIAAST